MKKSTIISLVFSLVVIIISLVFRNHIGIVRKKEPAAPRNSARQALDFWSVQRAYPGEIIPEQGFYKAFTHSKMLMKKAARKLQPPDTWESMGPINRGGRTIALAVDPNNPGVIYAGGASGGLWRLTLSTDDYAWEYIETGFPVLGVNAIAVDPADSKVIYMGTGEVYGYQEAIGGLRRRTTRGSYGIGLLKSSDSGRTWQKSIDWSYNQQRGVLCIRIHPLNSRIIFAGTSEGTYKSVNGGETWEQVHSSLMTVDIAINPQNPDMVFISCGNLSSDGMGIYRSARGGEQGTWEELGNGLPSNWGGKALLALCKSSPFIIYADIGNSNSTQGLYLSKDGGDTWSLQTKRDYAGYQGWFAHFVRVNPENCSELLIGGIDFYKSTDWGQTMTRKSGMHVDHHCYADHPTDANTVYIGNDGGVFRTIDGGEEYLSNNTGYVTSQFYNGFSSSLTDPDLALGGLQDNSARMFTGSLQWSRILNGDGTYTAIDPRDNKIMYCSMQNLAISRSTNGGDSWKDISGDFNGNQRCFVAPFAMAPSEPSILYAGEDYLYRTDNKGDDWIRTNGGAPLNGNAILSIGVSHTDPDVVYAATAPGSGRRAEVFASTDGGGTWANITGDLPDRYYVDLIVSPHNDRHIYITLSGFGTSHLYRSADGGGSWTDRGRGLPDVPTSAVIVDPEIPTHMYVGNDLGVYVSVDDGASWLAFKEDMPTAALVMDLSISASNRKLRAVTHGNGIYQRSLLPPDVINTRPRPMGGAFGMLRNVPNPFREKTTISFVLPEPAYASLQVVTAGGRAIRELAAGEYPAGTCEVEWDGKDNGGRFVADGSYVCRLHAGTFSEAITVNLKK